MDYWASASQPIVLVRHDSMNPQSPLHPDSLGNALLAEVGSRPHDLLVTKSVNSSFYGTPDLHQWLTNANIGSVTICGITTNHCCDTTARMAGNLGYYTYFVLDATHTFDRPGVGGGAGLSAEDLSAATAVNLHGEFATVMSTDEALRLLL